MVNAECGYPVQTVAAEEGGENLLDNKVTMPNGRRVIQCGEGGRGWRQIAVHFFKK